MKQWKRRGSFTVGVICLLFVLMFHVPMNNSARNNVAVGPVEPSSGFGVDMDYPATFSFEGIDPQADGWISASGDDVVYLQLHDQHASVMKLDEDYVYHPFASPLAMKGCIEMYVIGAPGANVVIRSDTYPVMEIDFTTTGEVKVLSTSARTEVGGRYGPVTYDSCHFCHLRIEFDSTAIGGFVGLGKDPLPGFSYNVWVEGQLEFKAIAMLASVVMQVNIIQLSTSSSNPIYVDALDLSWETGHQDLVVPKDIALAIDAATFDFESKAYSLGKAFHSVTVLGSLEIDGPLAMYSTGPVIAQGGSIALRNGAILDTRDGLMYTATGSLTLSNSPSERMDLDVVVYNGQLEVLPGTILECDGLGGYDSRLLVGDDTGGLATIAADRIFYNGESYLGCDHAMLDLEYALLGYFVKNTAGDVFHMVDSTIDAPVVSIVSGDASTSYLERTSVFGIFDIGTKMHPTMIDCNILIVIDSNFYDGYYFGATIEDTDIAIYSPMIVASKNPNQIRYQLGIEPSSTPGPQWYEKFSITKVDRETGIESDAEIGKDYLISSPDFSGTCNINKTMPSIMYTAKVKQCNAEHPGTELFSIYALPFDDLKNVDMVTVYEDCDVNRVITEITNMLVPATYNYELSFVNCKFYSLVGVLDAIAAGDFFETGWDGLDYDSGSKLAAYGTSAIHSMWPMYNVNLINCIIHDGFELQFGFLGFSIWERWDVGGGAYDGRAIGETVTFIDCEGAPQKSQVNFFGKATPDVKWIVMESDLAVLSQGERQVFYARTLSTRQFGDRVSIPCFGTFKTRVYFPPTIMEAGHSVKLFDSSLVRTPIWISDEDNEFEWTPGMSGNYLLSSMTVCQDFHLAPHIVSGSAVEQFSILDSLIGDGASGSEQRGEVSVQFQTGNTDGESLISLLNTGFPTGIRIEFKVDQDKIQFYDNGIWCNLPGATEIGTIRHTLTINWYLWQGSQVNLVFRTALDGKSSKVGDVATCSQTIPDFDDACIDTIEVSNTLSHMTTIYSIDEWPSDHYFVVDAGEDFESYPIGSFSSQGQWTIDPVEISGKSEGKFEIVGAENHRLQVERLQRVDTSRWAIARYAFDSPIAMDGPDPDAWVVFDLRVSCCPTWFYACLVETATPAAKVNIIFEKAGAGYWLRSAAYNPYGGYWVTVSWYQDGLPVTLPLALNQDYRFMVHLFSTSQHRIYLVKKDTGDTYHSQVLNNWYPFVTGEQVSNFETALHRTQTYTGTLYSVDNIMYF